MCCEFFISRGTTWDPDAGGREGTLTIPAGRDDEWAEYLWEDAAARFGAWADAVIRNTREGRHLAPAGETGRGRHPAGCGSPT